jgi:hypothetical protein
MLALSAQATSVDSLQPGGAAGLAGTPAVLPGDFNGDGVVDAVDFIALKRNMGKPSSGLVMQGDIDDSSTVGFSELQALTAGMSGSQEAPSPAVPEPLTMGLFALGMLAAAKSLRGRMAMPH